MKCPYCLSAVESEASVCKTCTRDLYLFKPLTEKIEVLEHQLKALPTNEELHARIAELETHLEQLQAALHTKEQSWSKRTINFIQFIVFPLGLLLIGHALITVVYDLPLLYLRLVSIALPLPFGFALFKSHRRTLFVWLLAVVVLAMAAVLGMSGITALVDQTPIWPQNTLEWKEFLEYGCSISLSFLTGMLVGSMVYMSRHRSPSVNPFLKTLVPLFNKEKMSPEALKLTIQKIEGLGGSLIALGTTAMSIYTGLKAVM